MSIFVPRPNEMGAINPKTYKKPSAYKTTNAIGGKHSEIDFGGAVKLGAKMTPKAQAVFNKVAGIGDTVKGMGKMIGGLPTKTKAIGGAGLAAGVGLGVLEKHHFNKSLEGKTPEQQTAMKQKRTDANNMAAASTMMMV